MIETALIALILVALFLVVVVAPLLALRRTGRLKRDSATREELSRLTRRVYALEQSVERLQKTLEDVLTAGAEAVPPPPQIPAVRAPGSPAAGKADEEQLAVPAAALPSSPPAPSFIQEEMYAIPKATPAPQAPEVSRLRGWADLEERLGANWLNKIGVAAFVMGTAFFLNYSIRQLGPAGKITVGYLLAAGLLVAGMLGERRERYRVLARAALGGGWALAYFTTYALHNIPVVRLVRSPGVGFALLFAVAAAMVAHSLRYNSQVATGFAYLLGFASVAASQLTVKTLVASALLAASLGIVLWRRRWYQIEPAAVVATYAVHWLWLRQMREIYGAHKPFPDFSTSVALCTSYWVIFTVLHFLRDARETRARNWILAGFVLNAAGYLAVLRYQSIHPEWRFWFLLATGAVYAALGAYAWQRGRRLSFLLMSTLGAALLIAAFPYRFSGARLELVWLVEAEVLLYVGWRLGDAHVRRLGWAGIGVLATYVLFHDLSPRLVTWRPSDAPLGWVLVMLAAACFANARLAGRLIGSQATEVDASAATVSQPIAVGFLMAAAWVALPFMWTALVWAALGALLGEAGRRLDDAILRGCGHAAALLAALRLLVINLQYAPPALGTNQRVITVGLAALLFYFSSRRIPPLEHGIRLPASWMGRFAGPGTLGATYTWVGTAFLALLIWNEVTSAAVGLAWALAGLGLVEWGRAAADRALVRQGHALLALSFARIFFADLNAEGAMGPLTARMISVSVLAALYYYTAATTPADAPRLRAAFAWFGSTALVALARFELPLDWIPVGWAALTAVLYFSGRKWKARHLRYQAYLLTLLVALRCAFDNFYQKAPLWGTLNVRTVTVGTAALALYVLLAATLRQRRKLPETATGEARHD